jgi:hypothetical protein
LPVSRKAYRVLHIYIRICSQAATCPSTCFSLQGCGKLTVWLLYSSILCCLIITGPELAHVSVIYCYLVSPTAIYCILVACYTFRLMTATLMVCWFIAACCYCTYIKLHAASWAPCCYLYQAACCSLGCMLLSLSSCMRLPGLHAVT